MCCSEYSKVVEFETLGAAPAQPNPPRLVEAKVNSLLLSWTKRPGDEEFYLQQEEQNSAHGFLAAYSGTSTEYLVENLHKSTSYRFRVSTRSTRSICIPWYQCTNL